MGLLRETVLIKTCNTAKHPNRKCALTQNSEAKYRNKVRYFREKCDVTWLKPLLVSGNLEV